MKRGIWVSHETPREAKSLADTVLHSYCPRAGMGVVLGR